MFILVIIGCLAAYFLGVWLYYTPKYRYSLTSHIPVHEAGHTLVAWSCSLIKEVLLVDLEKNVKGEPGGSIRFHFWDSSTINSQWCDLVITLAGIAAEVNIYGSLVSNASEDMIIALRLSKKLLDNNQTLPPWQPLSHRYKLPSAFNYDIVDQQRLIIQQGYTMARHVLDQHRREYNQLVDYFFKSFYC